MISVDEGAYPRRRPYKAIAIVLGIAVLAYLVAAPYITLYELQSAVTNKDVSAMTDLVDFPRVRESLKAQFTASVIKTAQQQQQAGNSAAGFGEGLSMLLAGPMIDAMVTPANVIGIMSSAQLPSANGTAVAGGGGASTTSMHYLGLNSFAFDVEGKDSTNRIEMVLCREGLGWRLCDVRMPG